MLCLIGSQAEIVSANTQISSNLGLPFRETTAWAVPENNYTDNTQWFFMMPPAEGWTREDGTFFTQDQMMNGVVNVTQAESQPNWFPPNPPI